LFVLSKASSGRDEKTTLSFVGVIHFLSEWIKFDKKYNNSEVFEKDADIKQCVYCGAFFLARFVMSFFIL